MKNRLTGAVTLGLAAALVLTGCGSGSGDTAGDGGSAQGGPVTLKMVAADYGDGPTADNSGEKFWKGVVDEFQAANPNIKVDVQVINWNDIDKQVATMVQNGQVPDILQTGDYSGFVADDLLYKVDEVLSPNTKADLLEKFAEFGKVNGVGYGIPFVSSARGLFYNKNLFDKAGIAEPPKTWDELKAAAEKLKKAGVAQPFGLPLGNEEAQAESFLWFMGNGGGYKDASGKWAIDSPQNIETFKYLKELVDAGLTTANPGTKNRKDVWADFAAGKVGMVNGGPMSIPIFEKGGLTEFGVAPIVGKSGPLDTTLGVEDWIMAFNKNGHQEEIKKFFDFFYSGSAAQKLSDTYKLLPVTKSGIQKLSSDEKLKPFLDALPNATFYPFQDPKWSEVNTQIKQTIGGALDDPAKVLGAIQKVATSG
ncbi:multiple sugar transport system substrate-binding protein [Thermocatellispora tengchongensis]|uniref:Multiple sugar transport system substrate-binding protein n=1 Tax=Thermocatellispora tengchongensis TaxID=1073253 RepID=A0A840PGK4_9ACTN|nr:extracellular solute-binding protein [Thermocatellispora tengchongensis]MBB5138698.1 multiple sugar transport system substrate-binding protein [Thermocatellispora tengchongensis]